MSATVREIVLKVKTQMEPARDGKIDYKQFATDQKKITQEVKATTTTLEKQASLWERIAKASERTATATKQIGGSRLPSSGGNSAVPTSAGGSGMGGMMGLGVKGAVIAAALATGRQVFNFGTNEWGARLHGGPLMKGSMGWYEELDDLFRQNKYRERKEDYEMADFSRSIKLREANFRAGFQGDQERDELAMSGLSVLATPRDKLDLLRKRNNWPIQSWRDQTGALGQAADALSARQGAIAADYRRYIGPGKVPGLMDSTTTAGDPHGTVERSV